MLRLLVCVAALALPVGVFGECRVVEYPDHNEVVCDNDAQPQAGQQQRKEALKLETTSQKEFEFYTPARAASKIFISADLSRSAVASAGDTLLSYRYDEYKDKVYNTTTATFVYEERTGEDTFTIREEGTGDRAGSPNVTSVTFNDRKNHLLLIPFMSGCPSGAADGIYLKMNRFDGNQLYYQIIIPPCLSRLMEQSITE